MSKINIDSPLYCPHDLSKTSEFRADLPTLINRTELVDLMVNNGLEKSVADCSIFTESCNSVIESGIKYLGPFERYKMVKPFVQAEDEKRREEEKKNDETINQESTEASQADPTVEKRVEAVMLNLNLKRFHLVKLFYL